MRWLDGFRCPRCGNDHAWVMKRGLHWCCRCDYQVSVTAGTIFQNSRKPLQLWFNAIWHVISQKNRVSARGLQRVLGMKRYETVWIWLHKLRTAMVRPGRDRLSGTVEVDETYIGGKKPGKRGRGAAGKALVLIAVEDKGNCLGRFRIRLRRVADASAASLTLAVEESVQPGSVVRTDAWSGYVELASENYEHNVVKEEANIGDSLLPLAHRVAVLLKSWLRGTYQGRFVHRILTITSMNLHSASTERTSHSRGKLFYRLIEQAVTVDPVTGQEIRGGRPDS